MSGNNRESRKRKLEEQDDLNTTDSETSPKECRSNEKDSPSTSKRSDFWNRNSLPKIDNVAPIINEIKELKFEDLTAGEYKNNRLKFRVTMVSDNTKSKTGSSLLSYEAMDSTGVLIAFKAFRAEADKFLRTIEINRTYELDGFRVQPDSELYPSKTGRDCIIILQADSIIRAIETSEIPNILYYTVPISKVKDRNINSPTDVIGVVTKISDMTELWNGSTKRVFELTDGSKEYVDVTIWGNTAKKFSAKLYDIVAVQKALVKEYLGTKSLSQNFNTTIWVDPPIDEAQELKKWFEDETKDFEYK